MQRKQFNDSFIIKKINRAKILFVLLSWRMVPSKIYKEIVNGRTCCPGKYCRGGVDRESGATMLSSASPEDVVTSRRDDDGRESTTGGHHPGSVASSTTDERIIALDETGLELPLKVRHPVRIVMSFIPRRNPSPGRAPRIRKKEQTARVGTSQTHHSR